MDISSAPAADPTEPAQVTLYTTSWCGYCVRLKAQMGRAGITYREVDIEADAAAEAFVKATNGGNATVPTLRFADDSALTNPTVHQVSAHLAALAGADQAG